MKRAPPKPSVSGAQKMAIYCWRIPPKYSNYYIYKGNEVFDKLLVSLLFVKLIVRRKPRFSCNLVLSETTNSLASVLSRDIAFTALLFQYYMQNLTPTLTLPLTRNGVFSSKNLQILLASELVLTGPFHCILSCMLLHVQALYAWTVTTDTEKWLKSDR